MLAFSLQVRRASLASQQELCSCFVCKVCPLPLPSLPHPPLHPASLPPWPQVVLGAGFFAAGVYALKQLVWPYVYDAYGTWRERQGLPRVRPPPRPKDADGGGEVDPEVARAVAEAIQVGLRVYPGVGSGGKFVGTGVGSAAVRGLLLQPVLPVVKW